MHLVIIEGWRYRFTAKDAQCLVACNDVIGFNAVDMNGSGVFHREGKPAIVLAIRKKFFGTLAAPLDIDRDVVLNAQSVGDTAVLQQAVQDNPDVSKLLEQSSANSRMTQYFE
jgi:hypothetical protein